MYIAEQKGVSMESRQKNKKFFYRNMCCIVPLLIYISIMIMNSVAVYFIHVKIEKDERINEMLTYIGLIDTVKRGESNEVRELLTLKYIEDYAVIEYGKNSKIVSSTFLYNKDGDEFKQFLKYKMIMESSNKQLIISEDKNNRSLIISKTGKERYVIIYFNNKMMEKRRIISTLLSLVSGLIYFAASIPIFYSFKKKMEEKNSEIKSQAMTDYLTGLYNRRACFIFLNKYIKLSYRSKTPLSLVYIDVDGLKEINDMNGHDAGDKLIKSFAEIAKQNLRSSDIFARIGGDEFLLILPGCNTKDAKAVVEKMRELCCKEGKEGRLNIEFSYGISEADMNGHSDADKLVKIADNRMYQNKLIRKYNKKIAEDLESEEY